MSISKNIWNCFSECKHGGNVLDFIAEKEGLNIHAAALKAIEWFNLDAETMKVESQNERREKTGARKSEASAAPRQETDKVAVKEESGAPNKPLGFRLDKLERNHP